MNRRSFMKKVGGALAGVVALALPSHSKDKRSLAVERMLDDKRISHTLFTDNIDPKMANIDPNSEWAKQKPLTVDELGTWIDVRAYGANSGDDTKAIQEAINLAGECIYIPEGVLKVKSFNIPKNIRIEGKDLI